MTSIVRPLVVLVSLTPLLPTAFADRGPGPAAQRPAAPSPAARAPLVQLAPIDPSVIPEPCKPLAKQAVAPTVAVAFQARISLASCMAGRAIAPLELCDCGASIVAIDKAVAPAIALLDDVIAAADPATRLIAEHAEGQLYAGFAARLVATLPPLGPNATEAETALRDMRKQTLAAQLEPWREAAMTSFQHVVDLAKAHPELASHRVIAAAVRDSEQQLAAGEVATR